MASSGSRLAFLAGLVLLAGVAVPIGAADAAPSAAATPTLSLSASPPIGDAPLFVSFVATPSAGVALAYDWNFGDGSSLSGSTANATPSHTYEQAGSYNVTVQAFVATSTNSVWVGTYVYVSVRSGPLVATVSVTPKAGAAPETFHFAAVAQGGTETYLRFQWMFGDGNVGAGTSINYTYARPGDYLAQLRVTDSAGDLGITTFWVNSTSSAPGAAPWWAGLVGSSYVGLAIAFALGAVAVVLFRSLTRPFREEDRPPPPDAAAPVSMGPEERPVSSSPMMATQVSVPARAESFRTSERVLTHLFGQGRTPAEEVAPESKAQSGIGAAVGVSQSALTHVLSRLEAGQLISVHRRHVVGRDRRLKTYELTPKGESIARELWERVHGHSEVAQRGWNPAAAPVLWRPSRGFESEEPVREQTGS